MSAGAKRAEGNELFRRKQYFEAYRCYQEALEKCGKTDKNLLSQIYANLSSCELIMERAKDAIESATKAIELNPSNYQGYLRRAYAYSESLDWKDAYNDYLEVAKLDPDAMYQKRMEYARQCLVASGEIPKDTAQPQIFKSSSAKRAESPPRIEPIKPIPEKQQYIESPRSSAAESNNTPVQSKYSASFATNLMQKMMNDQRPSSQDVVKMINEVKEMHARMPNIVYINLKGTIRIIGDTHGQYQDVVKLFEKYGYPSSRNPYLFNGDFVDRGSMGVEIVIALMAWKLVDPSSIYLNRGNHETDSMNMLYGFMQEACQKYSKAVFNAFSQMFEALPIGHVINNRILVVHGGLFSNPTMTLNSFQSINRFCQPPDAGPLNDILWADPMEMNGYAPSPRGVTRTFGPDVTNKFLKSNNLELLVRSHQVQEEGFGIHQGGKCVTIFSAPNYMGQMANKGALMLLSFKPDGSYDPPRYETFTAAPIPNKYKPMQYSAFGALI